MKLTDAVARLMSISSDFLYVVVTSELHDFFGLTFMNAWKQWRNFSL